MRTIRFFLLLPMLVLMSAISISQTITSTSTGGNWEDVNTWIGGVVPGENNDVVITSTISITSNNTKCGNLTINNGAILQNGGGLGWVSPLIFGKLTNNGTIRDNPEANQLWLHLWGDIDNNGIWHCAQTHLSSGSEQKISQTEGKKFESSIGRSAPIGRGSGIITALSDVTFATNVYLPGQNYAWSILDMNGYNLNLEGDYIITGVVIKNIASLFSEESFQFRSTTFDTDVTIEGTLSLNESNITFGKQTTVNGIIQNSGGLGWVTATFIGPIVNNGIIRNNPNGNQLWLNTYSDLHNNGTWINSKTNFSAGTEQKISQSNGKKFASPIEREAPIGRGSGIITALSNITFATNVYLPGQNYAWSILDMNGYNLNLEGDYIITGVVIKNIASLFSEESFQFRSTTFDTDVTIEGTLSLNESNITFGKQTTVNGIIQNSGGLGWVTATFIGPIVNNGIIRNNPNGNELWTISNGNILGNGIFYNSRNYVETNGDDNKINGSFLEFLSLNSTGNPKGGKVIINGELKSFGKTQIESGTEVEIAGSGKFFNKGELVFNGSLQNNGTIYNTFNLENGLSANYFTISASFISKPELDSIIIESYGNQVPASFGNAVKNWWRIKPSSENTSELFTSLTLKYTEEFLNNNNEEDLHIFHSSDSGKTWQQISSSTNITRDINNNSIAINDVPAFGDYILSSSSNPYSIKPLIVVSILGRSQLRIGPPNRFTINYANNSDTPTEDFFFTVSTGSNTRISRAEIPMADGTVEVFPIDSINMEYNDQAAMFFIAGLEPHEEGSFDIICTGEPLTRNSSTISVLDPFSIAAIGILATGAAVVVIDYIGGKAIENTSMSDEDKAKLDLVLSGEIKKEIKKEKSRGVKVFVSRKIGLVVLGKVMGVVGGVFEVAAAVTRNVKGVFQNLYNRAYLFIQKDVGYFGVKENEGTIMTMGGKKDMIGVTSWDPNEKIGPNGYGTSKHISDAGKMNYQILFENKKEATGAAYQIVIVDTLSSVFDPTTVEFGRTSHPGFSFKREGNILTWEIIGIELPPNVNPPEGEGWVSFSVNTIPDLASGTIISNKASIIFDVNSPIITNEVVNIIDYEAPKTQLSQSIVSNNNDELVLNWSANDGVNGSGISSTTIFGSVDGSPFKPVVMTFEDSAVFTPQHGTHSYSFYALSEDNVGNIESSFSSPISYDYTTNVESEIPISYSLSQNFPNPFNPTTTISYSIPEIAKVELKIFDILGREVVTLINQKQNAGSHKVDFNASNLSSGVYFYRLSAGQFSETKKLLLLR